MSVGSVRVGSEKKVRSPVRASLEHIPKQFREKNLKEGLTENFQTFPQSMYGLTLSQMDMFMTEDSHVKRKAEGVTGEMISSAKHYQEGTGMWNMTTLASGAPRLSMKVSMYRGGGGGGGANRPRTAPPDLPSLLLDARICYIGMPIVPAVTELVIAELLWLDFDNSQKPIYVYINSPGTQNEKRESISFETEAYAIADTMNYVKSKVYTVNCGQAYGQAAMLLAIGDKGHRAVQPNSVTKVYAPKVNNSSGGAVDMWVKAKELDSNTEYYIELMAKGTGKPRDEIAKDIRRPRYYRGQQAIDYGLCDTIIEPRGVQLDKKNYYELAEQNRAQAAAQAGRQGPQAAPGGRGV